MLTCKRSQVWVLAALENGGFRVSVLRRKLRLFRRLHAVVAPLLSDFVCSSMACPVGRPFFQRTFRPDINSPSYDHGHLRDVPIALLRERDWLCVDANYRKIPQAKELPACLGRDRLARYLTFFFLAHPANTALCPCSLSSCLDKLAALALLPFPA
jgi:hypothetical protein